MRIPIDQTTERTRREVTTARNNAYTRRDWVEVDRLTAILQTFPVKRSDGTYELGGGG